MFDQLSGHPLSLVKLTHKINHHSQKTNADPSGINKVSILLSPHYLRQESLTLNFGFLVCKVRVYQSVS